MVLSLTYTHIENRYHKSWKYQFINRQIRTTLKETINTCVLLRIKIMLEIGWFKRCRSFMASHAQYRVGLFRKIESSPIYARRFSLLQDISENRKGLQKYKVQKYIIWYSKLLLNWDSYPRGIIPSLRQKPKVAI